MSLEKGQLHGDVGLSRSDITCTSFSKVHNLANNVRVGAIKAEKGNLCLVKHLALAKAQFRYLLESGEGKMGQQGAWESIYEYLRMLSISL